MTADTDGVNARYARMVALVGIAATVAIYAVPWSPIARTVAYDVVAVACIAAIAIGIRVNRPPHRLAWWLVAAGNGLLVAGDVAYAVLESRGVISAPCPADLLYVAAYPCLGAGLYITARRRSRERAVILDGAIFSIASASLAWAFLYQPHFSASNMPGLADAVVIAYPLMDIAILVIGLRIAFAGGWRLPVQQYATAALSLLLVADVVYTDMALHDTYALGTVVDAAWLLSYIAWAAAALHPSMARAADPTETGRLSHRSHLGVLLVAAVTVPSIAIVRGFERPGETMLLFHAAIVVIVLCMLRLNSITSLLRRAAQDESARAQQMEHRMAALIKHSTDVIMIIGDDGSIVYTTPSVEKMLGWTPEEVEVLPPLALLHPEDRASIATPEAWSMAQNNRHGPARGMELRCRHKNGEWRHVEVIATDLVFDPAVGGLVLNLRDITERKALLDELAHQAFHDSLTGLPNRLLFADRVEHALLRRHDDASAPPVAVLFCDLDDFKAVNDTLGHGDGDLLLAEAGRRLRAALRPGDTAARLGGDEFAVHVDHVDAHATVDQLAERVLHALSGKYEFDGRSAFVTASVGVAAASADVTADSLMRDADAAMYAAKRDGKNRWSWFDAAMHEAVVSRLALERELRVALETDAFDVHYQPIVDLVDGRITGAEALVRWRHPERGLVSPADFIPAAEETGLIVPIGWRVLDRACQFAADRRAEGDPTFAVSVNLSALQLAEADMVARVRVALDVAGLDAGGLVLELTESLLITDAPSTLARLQELSDLGVRIAIDDFGTGYSSLSYLQRLPVDILKIDKVFIDRVGGPDADLVPAILDVARTLGLHTVAEGVEEGVQAGQLAALGCERAQGYFFARPLTAEAFVATLGQRSRTSWTISSAVSVPG